MEIKKVDFTTTSQDNLADAMEKHRRTAKDISAFNRRLDIAKKLSDSTWEQFGIQNNIG